MGFVQVENAIENTAANTINATYARRTIGRSYL